MTEYNIKYYNDNKKSILNYQKSYREDNKEKIKKWRDDNKEKILENASEKITCICGSCIRKSNKSRHERTKKHIDFINKKE